MKRFGFHPEQLYFNMRNPMKVRYLQTKELGKFEAPMKSRCRSLGEMHENFQKRLEFEKYLNPKGLKPTITSRFQKPPVQIDFVSHTFALHRTPKPYGDKVVNFRTDHFLSKPEIRQYLQKIYQLPITAVGTFRKQGKLMRNSDTRTGWRRQDWKKATVTVEFDVEPEFQKNL